MPRLHVVTDDEVLARPEVIPSAEALLEAGRSGLAFHVRGPHTEAARVYEIVTALGPAARRSGALLVVNDRVDVALAAEVGAVHLGARSLSVAETRRLVGPETKIGRSTHDPSEVRDGALSGVDFLFFGNVWETPSHPDRPGLGPAALREAAEAAGEVPVVAIGGVDLGRAPSVLDAGAHGVAVLRGVWGAEEPRRALRDYISALDRVRPGTTGAGPDGDGIGGTGGPARSVEGE